MVSSRRIRTIVRVYGADLLSAVFGNEVTVIFTPYKVGSTTLFDRLCKPKFCSGGHIQLITGGIPKVCHFAIKCHSGDTSLTELRRIIDRPINRIVTLLRSQSEIYLSAFFQNISDPNYSYYFGTKEEVMAASLEQLVDHFLSHDWQSHRHLQIEFNRLEIEGFCGVNYGPDLSALLKGGSRVYCGECGDGPVIVGASHIEMLGIKDHFQEFLSHLRFNTLVRMQIPSAVNSNTADKKWYKDRYREVRERLSLLPNDWPPVRS